MDVIAGKDEAKLGMFLNFTSKKIEDGLTFSEHGLTFRMVKVKEECQKEGNEEVYWSRDTEWKGENDWNNFLEKFFAERTNR